MPLRGWIVRPLRSPVGERRLLVACILRALHDAQRGDMAAWVWLDTTGRAWCALLDIPVDDWQAAAGRVERCRRALAVGAQQRAYFRERRIGQQAPGARVGD
jgi:hypothetical protein